jgi:hypothetical protein
MEGEIYFGHREWWFADKIIGMRENFQIAPFCADLSFSVYFPWNILKQY